MSADVLIGKNLIIYKKHNLLCRFSILIFTYVVAEGMGCHQQCNESYRCWGPADTDCVVCNVYLYKNGSERICVDSCDSPRLNL